MSFPVPFKLFLTESSEIRFVGDFFPVALDFFRCVEDCCFSDFFGNNLEAPLGLSWSDGEGDLLGDCNSGV